MILTEEQLNILNHVVGDGQAWADHIENVFDAEKAKECLLDKVARHKPEYDEEVAKSNYKNRKKRDDEEARLEQERYDNAPWDVKRRREYPKISELVVALYDEDDKAEIIKRRAEVKLKYPKE